MNELIADEVVAAAPSYSMTDVITYCPDVAALVAEVVEKFPKYLSEDGDFLVTKTPVQYSEGGATLALVRVMREEDMEMLKGLSSLEVLGTYEEVFSSPEKMKVYESVYNTSPVETEEGTYTPPKMFGVFA